MSVRNREGWKWVANEWMNQPINRVGVRRCHLRWEIGRSMALLIFIRRRIAPEHGPKWGPQIASSHVAEVISFNPTRKSDMALIMVLCKKIQKQLSRAQTSSTVQHSAHAGVNPIVCSLHSWTLSMVPSIDFWALCYYCCCCILRHDNSPARH